MSATALSLLALSLLLAPPAHQAEPPAPFEVTVSEAALEALLRAAAPIEHKVVQEVGVLGFTRKVEISVRLTEPRVRVSEKGISARMNYQLTDAGGAMETSGVATPELVIRPTADGTAFEARLTRLGIHLPGGLELGGEEYLEPYLLPATIPQELELGPKRVRAIAKGQQVVTEHAQVRIRGTLTFEPIADPPPPPAQKSAPKAKQEPAAKPPPAKR
jgi:hypothetical protein